MCAMNAISRESLCATCLSQDRKLFPVHYSKSQCLLLNLSERDKLCWECNRYVLKMATFRSQAARAQELLARARTLHGHINVAKIICLSQLTRTPVYLDIGIGMPNPLQTVKIQAELINEDYNNTFDECPVEDACNTSDDDGSEEINGVTLQVSNKQSEAKSDEIYFGEAIGDDLLTALSKEELKGVEGSCDVTKDRNEDDGDITNASLKSLLSRKSTLINIPSFARKFQDDTVTRKLDGVKAVTEEVTELEADQQPTDSDSIYTETIMSEKEMYLWRERKKNLEYYAVNNPALRCEHCIEPFRNKILSVAHKRRHQGDYGAFACHVCGLRSLSSSALRVHTAQHHRLLTCKLCGHEWDSRNGMRQHGSVAHGVPVTAWDCDQCDRSYSTQEQLKRHMVAHRAAACRLCGARVAARLMARHVQFKCGASGKVFPRRAAEGARAADGQYACADCGQMFRTRSSMYSHVRRVHRDKGVRTRKLVSD